MKKAKAPRSLLAEHEPRAIHTRLSSPRADSYLGDAVLGGIDGCVTTFSVVAGAVGASFGSQVILILGLANLLADGFSMAVSNYSRTRVEAQELNKARMAEEAHIAVVPEGEKAEIREIYRQKGFMGDLLDKIVDVITQNRKIWVDTMLREELGLQAGLHNPRRAALATFCAFVTVGIVPLLTYLFPVIPPDYAFLGSAILTAAAFAIVGLAKGIVLQQQVLRSTLETLVTGGAAAAIAFGVGFALRHVFGIAM